MSQLHSLGVDISHRSNILSDSTNFIMFLYWFAESNYRENSFVILTWSTFRIFYYANSIVLSIYREYTISENRTLPYLKY